MHGQNSRNLHSDYLITSFGLTTATDLSKLLDGEISHDIVTRFLSAEKKTAKDLWQIVKLIIREIERGDGCLIINDSKDFFRVHRQFSYWL